MWFQLIHTIPKSRKLALLNETGDCKNMIYLNRCLIKKLKTVTFWR